MKDSEIRRLEMFIRVRQYGADHAAAFPATSRGGEVLAELDNVVTELEGHAATQSAGARGSRESTTLKAVARAALREDMEAIRRTARVIALTMSGVDEKFRVPRNAGDQTWLAAARSFAQDAEPLKAEFIRRGLPQDFIDDLNADIESFEEATSNSAQKAGSRVAATVAIDEAIERGMKAVRELDAIVRNTFRDDPAALAGWTSASHTERAPRSEPPKPAAQSSQSNPNAAP
jgi:hypothetical protein